MQQEIVRISLKQALDIRRSWKIVNFMDADGDRKELGIRDLDMESKRVSNMCI